MRYLFTILAFFVANVLALAADGNRLSYLDSNEVWYPHKDFPKLITPQWAGEEGVECVVTFAIDDMRDTAKYEAYLRPILQRLKQIDGRAPVSIMTNSVKPDDPQLQSWLQEGLSIECHTFDHPCPILAGGDIKKAKATYDKCVDLIGSIPNNKPVAFRTPCCDSLNTVSPRLFSEIINKTTPGGNFLQLDSSVFTLYTADDPSIPRELLTDPDGREKFRKYIPRKLARGNVVHDGFVNTIENYPYPYVIQRQCWEFPCMVPSDWSANHLHKPNNPDTVRDLKAALDITVLKQGVFNLVFHPHGWIKAEQVIELIDHAVAKHGKKVKFLTFKECVERLNKNVLADWPLRDDYGRDNGVRLLDLNFDGMIDVSIAKESALEKSNNASRLWNSSTKTWSKFSFPTPIVNRVPMGRSSYPDPNQVRTPPDHIRSHIAWFGLLSNDGKVAVATNHSDSKAVGRDMIQGIWTFRGGKWNSDSTGGGLDAAFTSDRAGWLSWGQFQDLDHDGIDEFILGIFEGSDSDQDLLKVFALTTEEQQWNEWPCSIPASKLRDSMRFLDINEDGMDDVVVSDHERFAVRLFESKAKGWSIELLNVKRGEKQGDLELPPIVREDGSDNGFFVRDRHLCWINEDTDGLPDFILRVAFDKLLGDRLPDAKSPQAAKQSMRVAPGYRVDLVAHEPLTMDPVAFDWGPDGKLWVAEMADYPRGIPDDEPDLVRRGSPDPAEGPTEGLQNGGKRSGTKREEKGDLRSGDGRGQETRAQRRAGRIRYLEDTDGDGQYDKSTLFLEGVPFPNGVMSWKNGVLVSAAPDIFYAEDTDGDGKADRREVLFTGFAEGNQQHRANGFSRGLDNWLYLANGDSGGTVRSLKTGQSIDIRGRDIRIRPDTGEIEAVSGQTQFGRNRDDWGNWFGNNNSRPMYHYVLDDHYLRRNPHLAAPNPQTDVSVAPGAAPVFPSSRTLTRFNDFHTANRFTSACSSMVYRDVVLFGVGPREGEAPAEPSVATPPPEAARQEPRPPTNYVFISEPVHNLVHREIMRSDGISFTSQRAVGEEQSEFLSSTDNWFRPTQLKTGPDGAMYVADVYRLVIEHPQWIPIEWQKKLDLRAGHDKGRLWRVAPVGTELRSVPRLDKLTTAKLVAALDSPNGWQRDLVQQLLIDRADLEAMPLLRAMVLASDPNASTSPRRAATVVSSPPQGRGEGTGEDKAAKPSALARLHALCTLDGFRYGLKVPVLVAALNDPHPGVRRHAVRLCESRYVQQEALVEHLVKLVDDPDPQVRLQLAYTLGEIRHTQADVALGKLAANANGQPWMMVAVLSSLRADNLSAVMAEAMQHANGQSGLLQQLLTQATAFKSSEAEIALLTRVTEPASDGAFARWQFSAMEQYVVSVERRGEVFHPLTNAAATRLPERITSLLEAARKLVVNPKATVSDRVAAVKILGPTGDPKTELTLLSDMLSPQQPPELQSAALTTLGRMNDVAVAKTLLAGYHSFAPSLRGEACSMLLSRETWRDELLAALESKQLAPTDLDAASRQRLLDHKSKEVRERAAKLLAVDFNTDRAKLVAEYLPRVRIGGDVQHGSQLFAKRCAQCHKLGNVGHMVGPDLASLTDKSPEAMLTAILDPNRAVETKFLTFTAITKSGVTHTGILANETASSLTLRAAEAKETTLLRNELDELQSSTKSLMPEGLEREVSPTDASALIAYIRNNVPLPSRKTFPSNEPTTVKANADGSITLTPFTAEIYGPTIVIEEKYKNLGWWSSADDTVSWTINVPRTGRYAVNWTWACEASAAGNTCIIEAAGKSIRHKVPATSGWEDYQSADLGELDLPAGDVRFTAKPASRPLPALADVTSITLTPK